MGYAQRPAPLRIAPIKGTVVPGAEGFTYEEGVDLWGNDVPMEGGDKSAKSADDCAKKCKASAECNAFTYHAWGGCFTKSQAESRKFAQGATSGYLPGFDKQSFVDGGAKPVATAAPAAITDAPATAAAGGTAVSKVSYVGVNTGGVGCCRFAGGDSGKGFYTLEGDTKTPAACKALCTASESCTAFEVSAWEGCELHTQIPSHATETDGCTCMTKKVEMTVVTDAPATDAPAVVTDAAATDAPATDVLVSVANVTTEAPMATATTTPEAAPANYEEIIAENATEAGSVCLTSDGEAPSTRRNYYSWSNSWSLQTCADKCDGMLADGYGECYGFNLKDKFICTVYFEPVPLAKENTCETCVKRCFTSTSKTPTTSTVTSNHYPRSSAGKLRRDHRRKRHRSWLGMSHQ